MNSFASECLSENNIFIDIQNYTESEGEEISNLRILKKGTNKVIFSEELLGHKSIDKDIKFIDMDFDKKKEIVINSDKDPNHVVNYIAIKINCNKIERHPLLGEFGEFKGYDVSESQKKTYIYLDENHNIATLEYCYKNKLYLCKKNSFIKEGAELIRKYDDKGNIITSKVFFNNDELQPIVNTKVYLNKKPNVATASYLIKGDKVTILDEQTDNTNQRWYFINYKGKKDINMWIKAEDVDLKDK